jgi:hypothetical protein
VLPEPRLAGFSVPGKAVYLALDREQGVDPLDRLDCDRRLGKPRQVEELAPRMRPACGLDDGTSVTARAAEPLEAR